MKEELTIIYGASDDLIEISGKFSEEIGYYVKDEQPFWVLISDGTMLEAEYNSDGEWRFRAKVKGSCFKEIVQSVGEDGEHKGYERYTPYSDLVIFGGELKWVAVSEDGRAVKL